MEGSFDWSIIAQGGMAGNSSGGEVGLMFCTRL